ncbi:hypothetical protein [Actinomadura sp. 9N215]
MVKSAELFDRDIGAVMVRAATAADESELTSTLQIWRLPPDQFLYS